MEEDDLIPLSALQHYMYCPRQCALIHVEQQWAENWQTAEGRLLHQRADQPQTEQRHGVRTVTAMPLASPALGISGIADVVEFHGEQPFPVSTSAAGRRRTAPMKSSCVAGPVSGSHAGSAGARGALFYGETRRRKVVAFDAALRSLTLDTITATAACCTDQHPRGAIPVQTLRRLLADRTVPAAPCWVARNPSASGCGGRSRIEPCAGNSTPVRHLGRCTAAQGWRKHRHKSTR